MKPIFAFLLIIAFSSGASALFNDSFEAYTAPPDPDPDPIPMPQHYPARKDYGQIDDFLGKRGVENGRAAIIVNLGPFLLLMPEGPGSSSTGVTLEKVDTAWNLSDLTNPTRIGEFNCSNGPDTCGIGQGIHAHAAFTRFVDGRGYVWGNFSKGINGGLAAYYDHTESEDLDRIKITKLEDQAKKPVSYKYAGLTSWYGAVDFWEYNESSMGAMQKLTHGAGAGKPAASAEWNHLQQTGVTGFPMFSGHLMVVGSDQLNTGVAIYDISNMDENTSPELITVFNPTLYEPSGRQVGIGGYWVEPYGANKAVFAARSKNNRRDAGAFYVVDFENPKAPKLTCELYFNQDKDNPGDGDGATNPMYVNFQDQYAFVDHLRIDIDACETAYQAAKKADPTHILSAAEMMPFLHKFPDTYHSCESSQYFRPLGQVGAFGGYDLSPKFFVKFERDLTEAELDRYFKKRGSKTGTRFSKLLYKGGYYGARYDADWQVGDEIIMTGKNGGTLTVTEIDRSAKINFQGMCFFVINDEPDTRPPYVSGHRPLANQTDVPTTTMIHLHIPETLRTGTVANAIKVKRLDTNALIDIEHQLSHTGTISVFPLAELANNVEYEVQVEGIRDYMGNLMQPYRFTFTTAP